MLAAIALRQCSMKALFGENRQVIVHDRQHISFSHLACHSEDSRLGVSSLPLISQSLRPHCPDLA